MSSGEEKNKQQAEDAASALITCNAHWREYAERSIKLMSVLSNATSLREEYKEHSFPTLLGEGPRAVYGTLHRMLR